MSTVRFEPRISVNKLGEYMIARPGRRKSIIKAQKYPSDFVVTRYQRAYGPIIEYLLSDFSTDDPIIQGVEACETATPTSEWDEQDINLSIEALDAFVRIAEKIDLAGTIRERTDMKESAGIVISGVDVSVRPEILIRSTDRKGSETYGGVKLLLSKTFPHDGDSGEYAAAVLGQSISSAVGSPIDNSLCLVIDVFSEETFHAPKALRRRMNDIEAACEEISRAWSSV